MPEAEQVFEGFWAIGFDCLGMKCRGQRDVPGTNDVIGVAIATNSVTVNGVTAYRKVEYFQALAGTNNSSAPAWLAVTVISGGNTNTGNMFVPKTPESFGYDADGNMTNDGRWALTWDAENRLTKAESVSSGPTASKRKVEWTYDARGRRIRQTTHDLSSGDVVTEDLKFISDGWRNIAELNATNNALIRSYTWGLDLSGSLDGAGGVGGLLMVNSTANGVHFYAYDGNGNVAALVKASDGTVSANYEYDPFGQTLRATGPMAKENPFRFSTKYQDDETDLLYYGYRFYNQSTGRWLSRDPLGDKPFLREQSERKSPRVQKRLREQARLPAYLFLSNHALASIDPLGLTTWSGSCEAYNVSFGVGVLFVDCYLKSFHEIGPDNHAEWVSVKAMFALACPLGFPVGYTSSRNTYTSPPGTDHTAFRGTATAIGITVAVSPIKGWYITASKLGSAELASFAGEQGGFDFGVFAAVGRSWVRTWYIIQDSDE